MSRIFRAIPPATVILSVFCVLLLAQTKPPVPRSEYGRWESLFGGPELSPDGAWIAYQVSRTNGEREVRIRAVDDEAEEHVALWGRNPVISGDSRWAAWAVGYSEEEEEKLKEAKKPVRLKAAILELDGDRGEKVFEEVERFAFDETGRFLALHGYAPEEPKGRGADLRVLDLKDSTEIGFGNVSAFTWSEKGALLALTIATGRDEGNGLQVFEALSGRIRGLDFSSSAYIQPSWREKEADLAVLRSVEVASKEKSAWQPLVWRGLDEAEAARLEMDSGLVPAGLEVVRHRRPEFSDDARLLAIGLRPPDPDDEDKGEAPGEAAAKQDEPKLSGVQIWHSSDVRLFPEQKTSKERDSRRSLLALWHLDDDRLVQIGTDLEESTTLLEGWRHAVEELSGPYPWGAMFGRPYRDVFVVDTADGSRRQALERVRHSWESAGGRYLLSFDGRDYWTTDVAARRKVNITRDIDTSFVNTEYDTPTDLPPSWGVGGWLKDDVAVLLYDRYDVWRVNPENGQAARLTDGAAGRIVHRLVDLDPDEASFDPEKGLYFSLYGERTEQHGYARLRAGDPHSETLILEPRAIRGLEKAEKADVLVFRSESREDSPDLFVAGPDLADPRQLSRTNPFQDDYAWTRAELVDFDSESGRELQAVLLYPINHDPQRRYPMIVYTYELLSPQMHNYEPLSERDYYNFAAWTQHGYFVLMPDIVYTARDPGISALEAVRPAVRTIVERGLVHEAGVGLIGHSWGGYQATYLPTRTDIFAASVAGAPLTDFVSFMGQLHWGPGIAELSHWETGQARMEVPFWEDPEAHRRNSPIHKVHEMETPLLMAFGDNDGVVDWDQGTEFYNFARRAGKQMVLLVYEGEDHGFRREANQIDYHRRILEWFGHYLKGEPAPDWIRDGVSFVDLDNEKKRVAKAPEDRN